MPRREDDIFKALADGHRRQIVSALCDQPMVAGELARLVGLAPNAVSFHLKVLQAAELVVVKRQGRFLRYVLNGDVLKGWRSRVNALFVPGPDAMVVAEPVTKTSQPMQTTPTASTQETSPVDDDSRDTSASHDDRLPTQLL